MHDEKQFDPSLVVVEANEGIRSHMGCVAGLIVGATLLLLIYFKQPQLSYRPTLVAWLTRYSVGAWALSALVKVTYVVVILLFIIVVWHLYTRIKEWYGLRQRGVHGEAVIVGREHMDVEDGDPKYWIYYQFRPDFIVKAQDKSTNGQLYALPLGATLSILYLPDNPQATELVVQQ
jgi:hypothetical protein